MLFMVATMLGSLSVAFSPLEAEGSSTDKLILQQLVLMNELMIRSGTLGERRSRAQQLHPKIN